MACHTQCDAIFAQAFRLKSITRTAIVTQNLTLHEHMCLEFELLGFIFFGQVKTPAID
jgi:hypothetical protein